MQGPTEMRVAGSLSVDLAQPAVASALAEVLSNISSGRSVFPRSLRLFVPDNLASADDEFRLHLGPLENDEQSFCIDHVADGQRTRVFSCRIGVSAIDARTTTIALQGEYVPLAPATPARDVAQDIIGELWALARRRVEAEADTVYRYTRQGGETRDYTVPGTHRGETS
jgi:hypothetical protein